MLAQASLAAPPDAIIATSTSGLLPTRLSADMTGPERLVVGHPFNPVYLLPLVEVCAGQRTAPETVERAQAIYRALGMRPLVVRHEIDGFIADRLLEALWREALWLVADDVATVEEIDDAIRFGAGLRWAAMGTFLTYRLAGGNAGMRHFMAQFGPALELPWTRLTDVPQLDEELIEKVVEQSDAQADGRSIDELIEIRDDCLVSVLVGLKGTRFGAGEEIERSERHLLDLATEREAVYRDGWLVLHEAVVVPEWIDYNGHMTEFRYLQVLADATDAVLRHIGIDADYIAAAGVVLHGRNPYPAPRRGSRGRDAVRRLATRAPRPQAPAPVPRGSAVGGRDRGRDRRAHAAARRPVHPSRRAGSRRCAARGRGDRRASARPASPRRRRPPDQLTAPSTITPTITHPTPTHWAPVGRSLNSDTPMMIGTTAYGADAAATIAAEAWPTPMLKNT